MTYLAHSAHWILDVVYVLPFVGLLVWLFLTTRRDRRRAAREGAGEDGGGRSTGVREGSDP